MYGSKRQRVFDETAKEAAEHLLEQFWILRDREPEKYQLVREREQALRTFFLDKLGYQLIIHRHFAKLEKIPVEPEEWMGIGNFLHPRDYALLCCLLAFLENKSSDEQFLLSDLCEDLLGLYPGEEGLDWTHFEHRKSLVRVLQFAAEIGLLKVEEGDISAFNYNEEYEVLYDVPVVSRYFMRSYPKDLFQFNTKEEILESEWVSQGEGNGLRRRYRVYRQLFLSPVMYSRENNDADFLYLRNYRNRIREDIEKHSDFEFELYRNAAMLTMPERRARFNLYPENIGISDIAVQFAFIVRKQRTDNNIPLHHDGSLCLTPIDYQRWVEQCKERFGSGWSKQFREASVPVVAGELLKYLQNWKMARRDSETGVILLQPLLARITGKYPKEFVAKNEIGVEVNEE
ncbi:TIGR02678 family protein [Desulfofalx alkaliphila]|uniref:TIGR02678 family protein n=1 Tax=Desulfofalx alkaliphila TaxID=105483 RepID=UPI0004E24A40|nr:TIGR02678 family protein [Desulfofalx alkaliphila]